MKRKGILILITILLLEGCVARLDPFVGGTGVRANINGEKFVMFGVPGGRNCSFFTESEGKGLFVSSVVLRHWMDTQTLQLDFELEVPSPVVIGKEYEIGDASSMAKVTSRYWPTLKDFASGVPSQDPDDEQVVLLKGWISFEKFADGEVEALFELDGKSPSDKMVIRHGFLRLLTTFSNIEGGTAE